MFNLYDFMYNWKCWDLPYKEEPRSLTTNQMRVKRLKRKIKYYKMIKTKRNKRG